MSRLKPSKPRTMIAPPVLKRTKKRNDIHLHLVSESTGSLARHMVTVAMSQFPKLNYKLYEHPFCTSVQSLRAVRQAIGDSEQPLVFSALTAPRLKRSLSSWCVRQDIEHRELIQPLVKFVGGRTGHRPIRDAKRAHLCNDDYLRRIDAWEFTLQHDDSRRLESIGEADVILLGVSRVGKTPVSAYLGSLGYRVANVSLAREVAIPHELIEHRDKIVGLTIDADRLAAIRKRRFELNRLVQGRDTHTYYSRKTALDDVLFAEGQFRKLRIRKLDMTKLTVEETAARILSLLQIRQSLQ